MRNKKSCVTDPNSFVSNPGDRYRIEFSPLVQPDGSIELVESGKVDIQEYIESFRESTDMSYVIHQLSMGNTSVLTQKEPMYGDFTNMPKTYAEALQLVIDREADFMNLPKDVRNEFDNDFRKWFAQSGSQEWFEKMKTILPSEEKISTESSEGSEEVKE